MTFNTLLNFFYNDLPIIKIKIGTANQKYTESDYWNNSERIDLLNIKNKIDIGKANKEKELNELKLQINSIDDCNLKDNSKKVVLGDGNINSPIMLVGENPGLEEDSVGLTFLGEVGDLLKKMLLAINIKKQLG